MSQERINTNAESSTTNICFKECNPSLPIKENKPPRVNGFWTNKKELALLKEYANVFPPACKRGQHKEAWEQILASVNGVSPSDLPLSYDSCCCAVDWLVRSYRKSFEESNVVSLSGANRNRSEVEKAVYEIIKKNSYDDLKKEGREKSLGWIICESQKEYPERNIMWTRRQTPGTTSLGPFPLQLRNLPVVLAVFERQKSQMERTITNMKARSPIWKASSPTLRSCWSS
ncbi:hypothetical protein CLU79DRAFT_777618 [Phycomyces nitens]|nr:hypothetical protein CLU79DRAFT_777618 [Phycomyces nitens]